MNRAIEVPDAFWARHNSDETQMRIAAFSETIRCCAVCGRKLLGDFTTVHIVAGGDLILHPDDEATYVSDPGDMGAWDIGPECARKFLPAEYRKAASRKIQRHIRAYRSL